MQMTIFIFVNLYLLDENILCENILVDMLIFMFCYCYFRIDLKLGIMNFILSTNSVTITFMAF